ncbi:methyltransferase domain-containing protein [Chloroflexota bacterium]|nr:methyltransferase domain-containing protein [Chloroflexota bacterium]
MNENTPPVCSYEGSDYQQSFWDEGGRAYEDAAEAIALKKMLPASGRLMLELGAGAGRNTPRYRNYDRVVLLDYSRTQMEQARDRLGYTDRYIYIAADVYRLPFIENVFDGATMIRTLHHMAEPEQALAQVHKVMAPEGVFILEFANKRNLKSMLRYLLGKQSWSPYTLDPVEFAELNFDFHPKAVRGYLAEVGFEIQKQLTVSHFRMGALKRNVPTKLLAGLDSLLQWTGSFIQVSPSVFTRNRTLKSGEANTGDGLFACPACGAPLPSLGADLTCEQCGRTWPFKDGIYDFRIQDK